MVDEYPHETPHTITGSVACGVAPIPLLAVYSVVFLIHGSIKPVQPPDITTTKQGEFIAGCIAFVLLVLFMVAMMWLMNGRRRWPAAILQLAALGAAIDFVLDPTKGGALIPALLVLTSVASLVLMFTPSGWAWVDHAPPARLLALGRLPRRKSTVARESAEDVTDIPDRTLQTEPVL